MTTAPSCSVCSGSMPDGRGGVTCSHSCAVALRQIRHAMRPALGDDELLHASHHHRTYGLTCADFDSLLARAARRCELCSAPPRAIGRRRPASGLLIDHDHVTGRVRGLVCPRCNQAMRRVDAGQWPVTPAVRSYMSRGIA